MKYSGNLHIDSKFVLYTAVGLLAASLTACDGWFGQGETSITDFSARQAVGTMAVDLSWNIGRSSTDAGTPYCELHPGTGLDPVTSLGCTVFNRHYYTYPKAGAYQTSLKLYTGDGQLLDTRTATVTIKPISVRTLALHCPSDADHPLKPATVSYWTGAANESTAVADAVFGEIRDGYASVAIPVSDGLEPVHIAIKTAADSENGATQTLLTASLVPNLFGAVVWVAPGLADGSTVQDPPPLFHSRAHIEATQAALATAHTQVDMSVVDVADVSHWQPGWAQNANFMEIYVRGYQDSDGDGIGDLRGLTERLPYLEDLGINAIWLMPVHKSADKDHGYSVIDYRQIEEDYGDLDDFKELLSQAHQRGIAVIMDYLINHSSNAHPLFVSGAADPASDYRDWYIWRDAHPPGWQTFGHDPWRPSPSGWYYGPFSTTMPDFNLRKPDVVEFHINNLRYWLNLGVDGFRFDAVGMLTENSRDAWQDQPENHSILKRIHDAVHVYSDRYTICESPDDFAAYASENSCGNAFNFAAGEAILGSVTAEKASAALLRELRSPTISRTPLLLANHDSFAGTRVWDQLKGNLEQYRLAAQTYLLSTNASFTYYGEEIGLSTGRGLSGDHALRTPMSWTDNADNAGFSEGVPFRSLAGNVASRNVTGQINTPDSLYHHYRQLYWLRKQHPVMARGQLVTASQAGDGYVIFSRTDAHHRAVVAINYSAQEENLTVETGLGETDFAAAYGTHTDSRSDAAGLLELTLPARQAVVMIAATGTAPGR